MSERFNVLMCKFYKFYICAVVGIIIELLHLVGCLYRFSKDARSHERQPTISFVTSYLAACLSFRLCVYPSAWKHSAPTGRILIKFDI